MPLEPIKRKGYDQVDRAEIEEVVAKSVEANPNCFIEKYIKDHRSFNGRYIAADLFKETFEQYAKSKESRNRYNAPVHNSAAVLSAELFRRKLGDKSYAEQDTVVFLTGIPGSGKTSSVLSSGEFPSNYRLIFEGQLSNPITTKEKIQQVLAANLKPLIIVAHTTPENALRNTIKRFYEEGRGASINVMSDIQSGLPVSLADLFRHHGDVIALKIYDYRDRENPNTLSGWDHLAVLKSEGNHEQIKHRLKTLVEQLRESNEISDACYRQAIGQAPLEPGSGEGVG